VSLYSILPLSTSGQYILDAQGRDITWQFQGVAHQGLDYCGHSGASNWREGDRTYFMHDTATMRDWGVNLVRVSIQRDDYLNDAYYKESVGLYIDACTANNLLSVIDLHHWGVSPWSHAHFAPEDTYANVWNTYGIPSNQFLETIATDMLSKPMMVGVEINEFRPKITVGGAVNRDQSYKFRVDLAADLAARVHAINPNLLVLWEPGDDRGGWGSMVGDIDSTIKANGKALLQAETNIILSPHMYFDQIFGRQWIWGMYEGGDPVTGKATMYGVLDGFYLHERGYYDMPMLPTEWGSSGNSGAQVVADQYAWFQAHSMPSTYWAWFRQAPWLACTNTGMGVLAGGHAWEPCPSDWETPSLTGAVMKPAWGNVIPLFETVDTITVINDWNYTPTITGTTLQNHLYHGHHHGDQRLELHAHHHRDDAAEPPVRRTVRSAAAGHR
jgi:hypothetical protein